MRNLFLVLTILSFILLTGFNVMKTKKNDIISIKTNSIFKWKKGLCLRAIEKSSFYIPGAVFQPGVKIGDIMEISDDNAYIIAMEERPKDDRYPDIAVVLEKGVTMKLNRNCEVILLPIKGEMKESKEFIIENENPN